MTVAAFPLEAGSRLGDWYERSSSLFVAEVDAAEEGAIPSTLRESRPIDLDSRLEVLLASLEAAYLEASSDNWYGPGSKAVSSEARDEAISIIRTLPPNIPLPEVLAHPDGELAFEWYRGPDLVLTMSVGRGRIHYASTFGTGHLHGVEEVGREFPATIVQAVRRICTEGAQEASAPAGGR